VQERTARLVVRAASGDAAAARGQVELDQELAAAGRVVQLIFCTAAGPTERDMRSWSWSFMLQQAAAAMS
jgi:hypothetical protein